MQVQLSGWDFQSELLYGIAILLNQYDFLRGFECQDAHRPGVREIFPLGQVPIGDTNLVRTKADRTPFVEVQVLGKLLAMPACQLHNQGAIIPNRFRVWASLTP